MRRALVIGIVAAAVLVVVADAIAARAGVVAGAWPRADGPWLWYASRALGVTAWIALTLDVAFGLFLSTGAADAWIARARSIELHRWLSATGLALVGAHALVLIGDRFVRFDVLDAIVPFASSYRPAAVALGVIAAWAALVVHASFGLRKRIGTRAWRRLHALSFVAYVFASAHAIAAGTDAHAAWMRVMWLGSLAVFGALIAIRVLRARLRATG